LIDMAFTCLVWQTKVSRPGSLRATMIGAHRVGVLFKFTGLSDPSDHSLKMEGKSMWLGRLPSYTFTQHVNWIPSLSPLDSITAAEITTHPASLQTECLRFGIQHISSFLVDFFYHVINVLGVHCDIYKSSYNISQLNSPPPPLLE
jgi:hypothetical protein